MVMGLSPVPEVEDPSLLTGFTREEERYGFYLEAEF